MDYAENIIFTFDDLEFFIHLRTSKKTLYAFDNPRIPTKQLNSLVVNQESHRRWQSLFFCTATKEENHNIIKNKDENIPTSYGIPSKETVYGIFSKTHSFSNSTYNSVKDRGTSLLTYMSSSNKKNVENNLSKESISSYQLQQGLSAVIHGGFALYKLCQNYATPTEHIQQRMSDIMNGSFALYRSILYPCVSNEIIHERFNDLKHAAFTMFEIITKNNYQQRFYVKDRYDNITDTGFAIYQMGMNSTFNSQIFFQLIKGGCTLYEICFNKTLFATNSLCQYYSTITNAEFILNQYKWYTERKCSKEELLRYDNLMGSGIVLINVLAIPYPDMVTVAILLKSADVLYRTFRNNYD